MTIEIKITAKDKCCPFCGSHNIEADFDFYDWDEELALGLSCSECQTTGPEVAIGYFIYCYLRAKKLYTYQEREGHEEKFKDALRYCGKIWRKWAVTFWNCRSKEELNRQYAAFEKELKPYAEATQRIEH